MKLSKSLAIIVFSLFFTLPVFSQICPVGGSIQAGFNLQQQGPSTPPVTTTGGNGSGPSIPPPPPIWTGGGTSGDPNCGSGGSAVYSTCQSYATCAGDGRQMSGQADLKYYPAMVDGNGNISQDPYAGPLTDFASVRGNSDPFLADNSGFPLIVNVTNGCYVSFAFVPGDSGAFQMSANPSFGIGGAISISTSPGLFGTATDGVICSQDRGGSNSLSLVPTNSNQTGCKVDSGKTYYLNLSCGAWSYPSCNISYTTYSG